MKIQFLKVKNWLLLTAMGLFGLAACHTAKEPTRTPDPATPDPATPDPTPGKVSDRGEAAVMYGVPTMDFVVKGNVRDAQGKPVKGLQVVLVNQTVDIDPEHMHEDNPYVRQYLSRASDTTDAQGAYQCHTTDVPVESQQVIVRDIDGNANGSYEDQMFEVKFTDGDQTASRKGWNMGTREKKVDITVIKK